MFSELEYAIFLSTLKIWDYDDTDNTDNTDDTESTECTESTESTAYFWDTFF